MIEKNYFNPEDKGRFGFSASGKYRAPYTADTVWAALCIAAAAVAIVMGFLALVRFVRVMSALISGSILLMALAATLVTMVMCPAVIVTTVLLVRYILQGFECSYLADEEKFTAIVRGKSHTIYYRDVQAVHFLPHILNGAVRGYTVTVKVSGVNEEFGIVSDGYIAENTTPFYIIKERAEIVRTAKAQEPRIHDEAESSPIPKRPDKAETDEIRNAMDRMERIQGEDIEAQGDFAEEGGALPDIARRVSPTVNGYADDLPAVGNDGKVLREDRIYVGSDGRELSVNDIIAKGTFRVPVKPQTAVIIGAVAIVVYCIIFYVVSSVYNLLDAVTYTVFRLSIGQLVMVLFAPFYFGTIINLFRNGREYNYRANGRELVITSKGIADEYFPYSDVRSVTYKRMRFYWFIKGYKVEILTNSGFTKYNYVSHGFGRLQPIKNLPFEILRERTKPN